MEPTCERNPQAEQMADESMVRNLAAQAEAIWPQERPLFEQGFGPGGPTRVLDLGCGTGEITARLADLWPRARVLGIDLLAEHLELARRRHPDKLDRLEFRVGDAYHLDLEDDHFDLGVCRHVVQAIPDPHLVLAELVRVTRPGGSIHVLAEDYGMMHFHPVDRDTDEFWRRGPMEFARQGNTDLRVGRATFTHLARLGIEDLTVDYVTVDTVRVPRSIFAEIWVAWKDGYSEAIARATELELEEVYANFDTMIAAIQDPHGYGVWHVPVIRGRVPG